MSAATLPFMVEMNFSYGWDDAGWTEDDKPQRFASVAEALAEIDDHIKTMRAAIKAGDMQGPCDKPADFRVVLDPKTTMVVTPRQRRAMNNVLVHLGDECQHYEEMREAGDDTRSHIYHDVRHLEALLDANNLKRS